MRHSIEPSSGIETSRHFNTARAGEVIFIRFVRNIPGIFPCPFSLLLGKNNLVGNCVEKSMLQHEPKSQDWRQLAKSALCETCHCNYIVLSSFNSWFSQTVTRFILATRKDNSFLSLASTPTSRRFNIVLVLTPLRGWYRSVQIDTDSFDRQYNCNKLYTTRPILMYLLNSELFCEFPSQERIQQGCHSWYERAGGNYLDAMS